MPILTIAAMGQLIVMVSGGIDISIGSILGCAGIGVGLLLKASPQMPTFILFGAGLFIGLLLGAVNGSLIAWGKISPLIVTIGTLAAFRGLAFFISGGSQIDSSMIPDRLTSLANNGVPVAGITFNWLLILALIVAVIFAISLQYTVAGKNLFAFGSNPSAAILRGISGSKITFWVFAICGAMAGLAGVVYASRFGFVNPGSAGQNLELSVIAAAAIGGTKLDGGRGTVGGVLVGCLLLSMLNVALSVLGIDANWQLLTYGSVILIAVVGDGIASRMRLAA